jgi:hypothetical protein
VLSGNSVSAAGRQRSPARRDLRGRLTSRDRLRADPDRGPPVADAAPGSPRASAPEAAPEFLSGHRSARPARVPPRPYVPLSLPAPVAALPTRVPGKPDGALPARLASHAQPNPSSLHVGELDQLVRGGGDQPAPPGGWGRGGVATSGPSSRSPAITRPGLPSSRNRCRIGSYWDPGPAGAAGG